MEGLVDAAVGAFAYLIADFVFFLELFIGEFFDEVGVVEVDVDYGRVAGHYVAAEAWGRWFFSVSQPPFGAGAEDPWGQDGQLFFEEAHIGPVPG